MIKNAKTYLPKLWRKGNLNMHFQHTWNTDNMGYEKDGAFVQKITAVTPSARQYAHMRLKYYSFIHFGMNTMLDAEWGDGAADVQDFSPTALDTDQWCRVLKQTGSRGIIITAKHHDGFCLWDTKTTDYNVMNSPFGKDIVALLAESCKKYDLKLGIYISPWDRHEKTYGSEAYNDFYVEQLRELATNYGEIFTFWFDGACGEGPNGKKQIYDFDRYYAVLRELQPHACLAVCGPDIRWIGNEGGNTRESEWSVVPMQAVTTEKVANGSQQTDDNGASILTISAQDRDLGSREFLQNFGCYCFSPAECDVSVTPGWFWHDDAYYKERKMRTPEDIARIYMNTVGGNAMLLLNVPPDNRGLISDREIRLLQSFKKIIDKKFAALLPPQTVSLLSTDGTQREESGLLRDSGVRFGDAEHAMVARFAKPQNITMLTVEEELLQSQRVENFEILAKTVDGYEQVYCGTVIGNGKFCEFSVQTDELILNITCSRGNPVLKNLKIYG